MQIPDRNSIAQNSEFKTQISLKLSATKVS